MYTSNVGAAPHSTPQDWPISPLSELIKEPARFTYDPFVSVMDMNVATNNGTTQSLRKILIYYSGKKAKMTPSLREVLLARTRPEESIKYPVLMPFVFANGVAVEIIQGHKRSVAYSDTTVNKLIRCVSIPMDNSDPEKYVNYALSH